MRSNIVLVGCDSSIGESVQSALNGLQYDCMQILTVERELDRLVAFRPDLVVLDLQFPGAAGLFFLDLIRLEPQLGTALVMVLSEDARFSCMQEAFERGADEFLFKPFDRRELALRVRALLRRRNRMPVPGAQFPVDSGSLRLKKARHQAYVGEQPLNLTRMEFDILGLLRREKGRTLTREYLLKHLWGGAEGLKTRALDMHISNLRRKLGQLSACVETVPGHGYRFVGHVTAEAD